MPLYSTVVDIVNTVARECGLFTTGDPFDPNADESMTRLTQLLTTTGRWLLLEYPWMRLTRELTFISSLNTLYPMPDDFIDIVEGTFWDRTRQMPVVPMSPKRRAEMRTSTSASFISPSFAITDDKIELWPQPVAIGNQYALQYRSAYWVKGIGDNTPAKDEVSVWTDVVFLPKHLVSRALKRAYLRSKGYDSEAADQDFERAIALAQSSDTVPAPVISLGGQDMEMPIAGTLAGGSSSGSTGVTVFGGLFP